MRIHVKKTINEFFRASFRFDFELEDDDKREADSFNAGKAHIFLGANYATFDFPFDVAMPHPDLLCMAALKIISPYVGSKVTMVDRPVSPGFAQAVYKRYPHIKSINVGNVSQRQAVQERWAVSFSGGADSLAAANICPKGTPLILSARKYHDQVGKFESWYRTTGNTATLADMNADYVKICVMTDFEFLSTNHKWCIYPDNYAFTIPCLLLADHLRLSGIFTGDVNPAFTGDETSKFSMANFYRMREYYQSVGLDLDSPVKGLSELGTYLVNRYFGNEDNATTCQYGDYKKPCGKCIKCFRKTLIKLYLAGQELSPIQKKTFNDSNAIKNFFHNVKSPEKMHLRATFKEVMKNQDFTGYEVLQGIKDYANQVQTETGWLDKLFLYPYLTDPADKTMQECLKNLVEIFEIMDKDEEKILLNGF